MGAKSEDGICLIRVIRCSKNQIVDDGIFNADFRRWRMAKNFNANGRKYPRISAKGVQHRLPWVGWELNANGREYPRISANGLL